MENITFIQNSKIFPSEGWDRAQVTRIIPKDGNVNYYTMVSFAAIEAYVEFKDAAEEVDFLRAHLDGESVGFDVALSKWKEMTSTWVPLPVLLDKYGFKVNWFDGHDPINFPANQLLSAIQIAGDLDHDTITEIKGMVFRTSHKLNALGVPYELHQFYL